MRPLIDCDILRYEIGAGGQYYKVDEKTGERAEELTVLPFDAVAEKLDQRIKEICALVWATEEPLLFLSMDARTKKRQNKAKARKVKRLEKRLEENPLDGVAQQEAKAIKESMVYKPNFREKVAKKKTYKGNRKASTKPVHYDNLTEYILATYEVVMAEGLEADDLLSVYQRRALAESNDPTTIICTRDKDLRMVPGMHFGWECGTEGKKGFQRQFGPELVKGIGRLKPIYGKKILSRGPRKGLQEILDLKGLGIIFFGAQLIMGDFTDNIPGIPGQGTGAAYQAMKDVKTEEEMFTVLKELYVKKFGDEWQEAMLEQGRLLWMAEELTPDGKAVMWEIPECLKNTE